MLEGLRQLVSEVADLAVLSLFLIAGLVSWLPGVQRRWSYAAAALVLGTVLGLAARRMGLPDGLDVIAVMMGVVCGPVTAAKFKGKTIAEAIAEIREAVGRGGRDSG